MIRRSDPVLSAIKVIGSTGDGLRTVGQEEFVNVRDYLMTEVALTNANRSGVLANMTVKQLEDARVVDGQYVVSVAEHKTALTYGSAKIVLEPSLHHYLTVYCRHIRPQVLCAQQNASELFVSWNGASITSGQVTKSVQRIWGKAGLGSNITLNIVRKSAVSSVHEAHPARASNLADLMCHRQSTAQNCYRLVERERSSVLAARTLAETFSGLNSTSQSDGSAAATATDTEAATVAESHTRHDWDTTSLSALRSVFGSDIAEGVVTLETVRSKIADNELLTNIGSRKVYDRVRNEIRKTYGKSKTTPLPTECETTAERVQRLVPNEQQLSVEPEDSDSECVAPSTSNNIFSEKDVAMVTKLCMHMISRGPVSEKRINEELNKSSAGRSLLRKFSLHQLKNRIKYERRKILLKV